MVVMPNYQNGHLTRIPDEFDVPVSIIYNDVLNIAYDISKTTLGSFGATIINDTMYVCINTVSVAIDDTSIIISIGGNIIHMYTIHEYDVFVNDLILFYKKNN
jgi:hypothetical protein